MADDNIDSMYACYADVTDFTCFCLPSLPFLKVFHLNIRSLNKNCDMLVALLASLKMKFDLIVLSELWIFNLNCFDNLFPGYNFHYNINPNNHSSGIGIYVSNELDYALDLQTVVDGCEYLELDIKISNC